jgi:hypothetical protein
MKLLRSHTSYDYYIKTVYSEFELDAFLARKSEKTVVVSPFHGECNEPILKKMIFSSLFPTWTFRVLALKVKFIYMLN